MKIKLPLVQSLVVLFAVAFLAACGQSSKEVKAEGSSPEYTATKFFYAIYDEKSMEKAQEYATPKLKRLLKGYGNISGVTRNMLNMYFDEVEIEIEKGGNLRESYGDKATLTLIFNGKHHGNKITDVRVVKLVKRKGTWLVEKVKDDPYAR
jgi:hypothetical protein